MVSTFRENESILRLIEPFDSNEKEIGIAVSVIVALSKNLCFEQNLGEIN